MRKIKLMLLSIVLLCVVGGALAFKAKYDGDICYTFLVNGACQNPSGTCVPLFDAMVTPTGVELCTTHFLGTNCNGANCNVKNKIGIQP